MVYLIVSIETTASLLPACRIGRVNEMCNVVSLVLFNFIDGICLNKGKTFTDTANSAQTLSQGIGIPTTSYPFPILSTLHETGSRGHNAPTLSAILDNGAQSFLMHSARFRVDNLTNVFYGEVQCCDTT